MALLLLQTLPMLEIWLFLIFGSEDLLNSKIDGSLTIAQLCRTGGDTSKSVCQAHSCSASSGGASSSSLFCPVFWVLTNLQLKLSLSILLLSFLWFLLALVMLPQPLLATISAKEKLILLSATLSCAFCLTQQLQLSSLLYLELAKNGLLDFSPKK